MLRNAKPRSPGVMNPSPSMSNRENASFIMASCRPRAPLAADDPRLSAAARSAVAAAIPTFSMPQAPPPPRPGPERLPLDRKPVRLAVRSSLLPRRPGCCRRDSKPRERREGGSAVELRLRPPVAVASVETGAAEEEPAPVRCAIVLESWRSAVARPGAPWGAAAAAVAAVAGMAKMAASRSAFLRHKKASVAGSSAGKRKFAVPTWSMVVFGELFDCYLAHWINWALSIY